MGQRPGTGDAAQPGLSGRELEVARLLIDGATDAEVADRLHVSARTVRTAVARLQQRYGTSSRMALGFHLARDERMTNVLIPAPRGRPEGSGGRTRTPS
ncbi:helix-turn-helix transcriptional regulator [Saccharopolyspora spinosporotrichia]